MTTTADMADVTLYCGDCLDILPDVIDMRQVLLPMVAK
jgi:DNA modification methylase